MKINVDRDNVGPEDAAGEHAMTIDIEADLTFTALFQRLVKMNYFPRTPGNDAVWALVCRGEDIAS